MPWHGGAVRNGIHAAISLMAAGVVWAFPPTAAAAVLAGATFVALVVELVRRVSPAGARAFQRRLGAVLKEGERSGLTGATALAVGFTLTGVLLPGTPALAGILFTGLGDPAAAVVGRRGRLRYPGGKSVAGSGALMVVVFVVSLALGLGVLEALVAATLTALAEAPSLPMDDNLYLPLAGAGAVLAAGWMVGV